MENKNERWAIVELMGHAQTAGIIKTSDLGGLLRVDVPTSEGFRTEYYGAQAIYAIRVVSEEIARAFALPERDICAYDTPIVPRTQYEEALRKARNENQNLEHQVEVLHRDEIMQWMKSKIKKWLGITELETKYRMQYGEIMRLKTLYTDLVSIGVDVHFKEPHMILIYSRLNGGQIREIRADFRDIRELQQFVEELRHRFNTQAVTLDRPRGSEWMKG